MRSKTYMSKINLQAETTNSGEQEEQREKTDMLRSIGKQSGPRGFHGFTISVIRLLMLPPSQCTQRSRLYTICIAVMHKTVAAYWFCFCSLAVLDPRVGNTMGVLSPFISVLCHSD